MARYAGILPYAIVRGEVAVLLGKEIHIDGWNGSNKWAPFGGSIDPGETVHAAAMREGYEETMGMFGTPRDLERRVDPEPWTHQGGATYLLRISYDKRLPSYFRNFLRYSQTCTSGQCPEGWYEKTQLKWVWLRKLHRENLRPEFRDTLRSLQQRMQAVTTTPS